MEVKYRSSLCLIGFTKSCLIWHNNQDSFIHPVNNNDCRVCIVIHRVKEGPQCRAPRPRPRGVRQDEGPGSVGTGGVPYGATSVQVQVQDHRTTLSLTGGGAACRTMQPAGLLYSRQDDGPEQGGEHDGQREHAPAPAHAHATPAFMMTL